MDQGSYFIFIYYTQPVNTVFFILKVEDNDAL